MSPTRRYQVFTSFHGPDVPKTFVSHLRKQLSYYEISVFDDQAIEGNDPARKQAIRESRISIVVLSRNYASSSRYLDELSEILKCKEEMGQMVMTISYGVHLSDVYKQTGEFGKVFRETCRHQTDEEKQRWSQALIHVASLKGYAFSHWYSESKMIEKIARDVSNELKGTIEEQPLSEIVNHNGKSKNRCCTGMAFLVVINLLMEIASAVADQLSSIRKPYFSKISLLLSIVSVVLSIADLHRKIRKHRAQFRWKWMPMPWFYYSPSGENIIFGSFTDTALLFCGVGQLIVSTINCSFIERRREGPIKVSVWPLFFAIGMLCSKFMETPLISEEALPITKMY